MPDPVLCCPDCGRPAPDGIRSCDCELHLGDALILVAAPVPDPKENT